MDFILRGHIVYNKSPKTLNVLESGYLVCEMGISKGAYKDFEDIPRKYYHYHVIDYGNKIIVPGLVDLHTHAPQYTFRGVGMDLELLDWLNTHTFPEESKYVDVEYADKAYSQFAQGLKESATSRAVIFGTIHNPATCLLMDKMERTGVVSYVGKVNMDRNSPDYLIEESPCKSLENTEKWIDETKEKYLRTKPIITPRFMPSCSDMLMKGLGELQRKHRIPVQSHISESKEEIAWVKKLCPTATSYGDAYDRYGLFGGEGVPTIMAHCVWSEGEEEILLKERGVYVAHCPGSNTNLASGIAPIRRFMDKGINVGLGTDVAGGSHISVFRAMSDAIQSSKMYWRLIDQQALPITVSEALYLATIGGGSFFGNVGSFDDGYEFDAIVVDDSDIETVKELTIEERLERIMYLSSDCSLYAKYVQGRLIR